MTDETTVLPEPTPAPEPAAAPSAAPTPAGTTRTPAGTTRRRRTTGTIGQVAGVVGVIVSLLLIVVVVMGRGWAIDKVNDVAATVDGAIAKAQPLVTTAQTRVADIEARVSEAADAADALAANPGAVERLQGLLQRVNDLSASYLELRNGYSGAREQVMTALSRLQAIDRFVPGFDLPQGPIDALASLDAKVQEMDGRIMDVIGVVQNLGSADTLAASVAEKARAVETLLGDVSSGLDRVATGLANLQAELASTASTVTNVINIAFVVLVLFLLYVVLLHVVLFRWSRGYARAPAAA